MPKRTKAVKVSDRKGNKAWLRKAEVSTYKIETREKNKLILIVCEGQTEELYFKSFPVLTLTVEIIPLGGQSKLKLIESTLEIIKHSEKKYDEIWCVFDMDVNKGAKEFSDFDNAIEKGMANKLKIAYSNDAFELWFYLHYQYTEQQNHRHFYYEFLSKQWKINYERDGKKRNFCSLIYDRLKKDELSSQKKATQRAEKLYLNQTDLKYHQQNPATTVYQLVQFLNGEKRK